MAMIETSAKWTFTSSGTGDVFYARGYAQALTFGIETSSGCTAVVQITHRMGSSAGPRSVLSTVTCTVSDFVTAQFLGPLEYVTPRVTDKTAGTTNTITIYLLGN